MWLTLALLTTGAAAYVLAAREEGLALEVASRVARSALADSSSALRYDLPLHLVGQEPTLADVNLYERLWVIYFQVDTAGAIVVNLRARRGVLFVPMFNTQESVTVTSLDYARTRER